MSKQRRVEGQGQTELQASSWDGQEDRHLRPADVQQRAGHREVGFSQMFSCLSVQFNPVITNTQLLMRA